MKGIKMSNRVYHHAKYLGKFKTDEHRKTVFIAENFDSLEALLKINDLDKVQIETMSPMLYSEFKDLLKGVTAFYPDEDSFLLNNYSAKTLEEVNS
jgi:hypothetical protein